MNRHGDGKTAKRKTVEANNVKGGGTRGEPRESQSDGPKRVGSRKGLRNGRRNATREKKLKKKGDQRNKVLDVKRFLSSPGEPHRKRRERGQGKRRKKKRGTGRHQGGEKFSSAPGPALGM